MRPSTAVLAAVTLLAGIGGGAVTYERASTVVGPAGVTAGDGATEITAVVDDEPATSVPGTRWEWAPCEAPAVLRGDTCVTTVVRTVVLPGAAPAASTPTGRVREAPAYQDEDDEEYDDEGDDHEDEGHDDEHDEDD